MQQTDKYKLNLMDRDDAFSPDPLNENMEKLEAAIVSEIAAGDAAEAQIRADADSALDARVQSLEAGRIVVGYADGYGFVDLGFTPRVLFARSGPNSIFITHELTYSNLKLVEGGFTHAGDYGYCHYIAIP